MQDNETRLGEVVETSTTGFVAQCYQLYGAPPLGALVRAGRPHPAYGVVHQVTTQGIDPTRRPVARGQDSPGQRCDFSICLFHQAVAQAMGPRIDAENAGNDGITS